MIREVFKLIATFVSFLGSEKYFSGERWDRSFKDLIHIFKFSFSSPISRVSRLKPVSMVVTDRGCLERWAV